MNANFKDPHAYSHGHDAQRIENRSTPRLASSLWRGFLTTSTGDGQQANSERPLFGASGATLQDDDKSNDTNVPSLDCTSEASSDPSSASLPTTVQKRTRSLKSEQWDHRFSELAQFKRDHGHCLVPYSWPSNQPLAQWVKRQRHQFKLYQEGKHSNMNEYRVQKLGQLGFSWSSQDDRWEERYHDLIDFKNTHGHCDVPFKYAANRKLAIWTKCQRRQFKLMWEGKKTAISIERVFKLQELGFIWNPRNLKNSIDQSKLLCKTQQGHP